MWSENPLNRLEELPWKMFHHVSGPLGGLLLFHTPAHCSQLEQSGETVKDDRLYFARIYLCVGHSDFKDVALWGRSE